ncbi:hypothetical protein Pla123a_45570 [Posidoniimonas polymericola]|uniref:Uncharacterized protein n=1 Tax=Posidoniimonas polymericola TaxID=2528002 RepID=A0A5C5XWJ2_9BACT|nr:hypothetical protein [Posidoniimonas polymericola]TWT66859.1 hypothetical protein Pla123a_45570 [Posidoniimonas polymericola]
MPVSAVLTFQSGETPGHDAPRSVDPGGKYTFGDNFPKMIDQLDESARQLGVPEPSSFIWYNPLLSEGELNKLTSEEFKTLEAKCNATAFWAPMEKGIATFKALVDKYPLYSYLNEEDGTRYFIAFEVACYHAVLVEAAENGETGFHLEIY